MRNQPTLLAAVQILNESIINGVIPGDYVFKLNEGTAITKGPHLRLELPPIHRVCTQPLKDALGNYANVVIAKKGMLHMVVIINSVKSEELRDNKESIKTDFLRLLKDVNDEIDHQIQKLGYN